VSLSDLRSAAVKGRRAPGRGLPSAGGGALAPPRGAAQRRRLDLNTAQFGKLTGTVRMVPT
jgi:hypothetical protein